MRTFGLDVHKRFAEVAVIEDGEIRRVGRIENGSWRHSRGRWARRITWCSNRRR
jgi:hypothetical protein